MRGVWSFQSDMPSFRDPEGMVWVWDAQSKTYTKQPEGVRPDPEHSTGGDNDLFSTNQLEHSEQVKNPLQEGFMASYWDDDYDDGDPWVQQCENCGQTARVHKNRWHGTAPIGAILCNCGAQLNLQKFINPDDMQPGEMTISDLGVPPEAEQYYRTAAEWASPNEVKCPNCAESTLEHTCPQCGKDLTPEWNSKGDNDIAFDSPVQQHHLDGMPERVVKPNHNHWDNSFPSMISHAAALAHMRKLGFDGPDDELLDMFTSGPLKTEVGKWLLDRQGQLHYEHGVQAAHERIAMRDGLNWPNDAAVTGSVYNDGSADVLRIASNFPFDPEQAQTQLAQAFGEGIHLDYQPVGGGMDDFTRVPFFIWRQGGVGPLQFIVGQPNQDHTEIPTGVATFDNSDGNCQGQVNYVNMGGRWDRRVNWPEWVDADPTAKQIEQQVLAEADQRVGYNKTKTANYLRIDPMTPKPQHFAHIDEELAWTAAHTPALPGCPECHAPMMQKNASTFCPDCGHIAAHKESFLPLILEGLAAGGEVGAAGGAAAGMEGGAAGAGGLGGMGGLMNKALQGAAWQGGKQMVPGGDPNAQSGAAQPSGSDGSEMQGLVARTAADDDDETGVAAKDNGTEDNPAEKETQSFNEEHGDSPELLKDVDGIGGPKDSAPVAQHDPALQHKALKAYHMNLPLVIEFANSDESGMENPILKALDELLEQAFPGYKDGTDPAGGTPVEEHPDAQTEESSDEGDDDTDADSEPKSKESNFSLWHVGHEVEASGYGAPTMPMPGVPPPGGIPPQGGMESCPTCGQQHLPGMCPLQPAQQMQQPGAVGMPAPQIAGGQQMTMPGSAVAQKVVTHADPRIAKWTVIAWGNPGDGYSEGYDDHPENYDLEPNPECPVCGGPGVPLGTLGSREHFRCRNCGMDFSNDHHLDDPAGNMEEPYPQDRPDDNPGLDMPSYNASVTAAEFMYAADEHTEHHNHEHAEHSKPSGEASDNGVQQQWMDEQGLPLSEGSDYELKSPNYQIPDRITVLNVLPEKLIFTIHSGDVDYQDEITKQDIANEGYTFGPVTNDAVGDSEAGFDEAPVRPGQDALPQEDDLSQPSTVVSSMEDYTGSYAGDDPSARDWLNGGGGGMEVDPQMLAQVMGAAERANGTRSAEPRYAGKGFSPREQREFIDERGTARNLDQLNLAGTHYVEEPELDIAFNW